MQLSRVVSLPPPPISAYQGFKNDPITAGQLYVSVDGIISNVGASKDQNLSAISLLCSRVSVNEIL